MKCLCQEYLTTWRLTVVSMVTSPLPFFDISLIMRWYMYSVAIGVIIE